MTDDFAYRMALLGMLAIFMPIGFRFRIKANTGEPLRRIDEGRFIMFGLRMSGLFLFICMISYLFGAEWIRRFAVDLPASVRWSGLFLGSLAAAGVVWTFSNLGKNLTDTVTVRRNAELVTSGPYRWVRHPFYLAALTLHAGIGLLSANLLIIVMGVPSIVFLALRTPIEEAKLIERFGDRYRDYAARTGRFLPRLRGSGSINSLR